MIPIPFKLTQRVDVASPLRKYLVAKYGERAATDHATALSNFQELRDSVATVQTATPGVAELLAKYHAQIVAMQDKFPIYETGVRVSFSWVDTFHPKRVCTQSSWKYETACVLFNLAACQWQQATTTTRSSPDAIEAVAKLFCAAAGVLAHIRDAVAQSLIGDIPSDLLRDGLNMQIHVSVRRAGWRSGARLGGRGGRKRRE